jgi:hypothetical protein
MNDELRQAAAALDDLVRADGARFELATESPQGGVLRLRLILDGADCRECVLPKEVLEAIAIDRLRAAVPTIARVEIDDPRETA